jgi:CarD family transcriptional regulator
MIHDTVVYPQILCEREETMQFSVGDKVVHPHHGPGQIIGVERREFLDGKKLYYEITIPAEELSVYLTSAAMTKIGVRPAMHLARLARVLAKLESQPDYLPDDFKKRQDLVCEKLNTGRVMQVAEAIRDLAWHKKRDHLTKRDTDLLAQGKNRLASEMALVSGAEVSDMVTRIDDTLAAAHSSSREPDRHYQQP